MLERSGYKKVLLANSQARFTIITRKCRVGCADMDHAARARLALIYPPWCDYQIRDLHAMGYELIEAPREKLTCIRPTASPSSRCVIMNASAVKTQAAGAAQGRCPDRIRRVHKYGGGVRATPCSSSAIGPCTFAACVQFETEEGVKTVLRKLSIAIAAAAIPAAGAANP